MRTLDGILFGWVDSSIRLLAATDIFSQFPSVLITSIDSSRNVASLAVGYRIVEQYKGAALLGQHLLVRGADVGTMANALNLFNGFDELWCFAMPPTVVKPDAVTLVAPLNLDADGLPSTVAAWMKSSHCLLGLGDGVGLNYATTERSLADSIEGLAHSDEPSRAG